MNKLKKGHLYESCFGHFFVCLFFKLYRAGFMKTFLKKLQNVTDKVEKTSKAVFFFHCLHISIIIIIIFNALCILNSCQNV